MRPIISVSVVACACALLALAGCMGAAPGPAPPEEPILAAPPEPEPPPRYEPIPIPESEPPPPPPKAAPAPAPGTPTAAAKPAPRLERGTNRAGGDYTSFALDTPDPNACRMACEQEERCRAFTYTAPGVMGEMAYCSLKETVPAAKPSSCCVSGVK
jgi:hypothetical protein